MISVKISLLTKLFLVMLCLVQGAWAAAFEEISMHPPFRIVQITDTHIMAKGAHWYNRNEADTDGRLEAVVAHINNLDPKPDIVLHTGDISEKGDAESYLHAKEILNQLTVPYFVTCGNHDNFDALAQVFTDQPFGPKFSQYSLEGFPVRILMLDSHVEGKDYGLLCDERKQWLTTQLKQETEKPTLIFIHHFPIQVQEPIFAPINLRNANDLEDLVKKHSTIKGIYCGHYHHAGAVLFGGVMCWIGPSTAPSHIVDDHDCKGLNLTYPSYSLHEVRDGEIISKIISVAPVLLIDFVT